MIQQNKCLHDANAKEKIYFVLENQSHVNQNAVEILRTRILYASHSPLPHVLISLPLDLTLYGSVGWEGDVSINSIYDLYLLVRQELITRPITAFHSLGQCGTIPGPL